MSWPAIRAVPADGGRKPVRTRIVVVFPAPLGPRNPTISPSFTEKVTSATAVWVGYFLVRF